MIAFLINELDIRGGTHKQLLKLLEYTSARTDDFFIVTKRVDFEKTYPGFRKFEKKIRIFNPADSHGGPLEKIRVLRNNIKDLKSIISDAECINIHDQGFERYFSAFKSRKVIWQVNDLPHMFQVGVSKNARLNLKSQLFKKIFLHDSRVVNKFTVNVTKNADRIKEAFNRDADVLYCGIEPVGIKHDVSKSLERFRTNKLNLLSSGVFFPYRNYETQVDVVEALLKQGIDVHLNIIGSTERDKDYSKKIKDLISQKGLQNNITVCGQVDEATFRKLHEEADIFMFINVDQSWGLAVFEAMSCGIPVIVSESVGATEILENDKNALFVNPKNSDEIVYRITDLMHNPETYASLCEVSSKFHERYSWDDAYSSKMFEFLVRD